MKFTFVPPARVLRKLTITSNSPLAIPRYSLSSDCKVQVTRKTNAAARMQVNVGTSENNTNPNIGVYISAAEDQDDAFLVDGAGF